MEWRKINLTYYSCKNYWENERYVNILEYRDVMWDDLRVYRSKYPNMVLETLIRIALPKTGAGFLFHEKIQMKNIFFRNWHLSFYNFIEQGLRTRIDLCTIFHNSCNSILSNIFSITPQFLVICFRSLSNWLWHVNLKQTNTYNKKMGVFLPAPLTIDHLPGNKYTKKSIV